MSSAKEDNMKATMKTLLAGLVMLANVGFADVGTTGTELGNSNRTKMVGCHNTVSGNNFVRGCGNVVSGLNNVVYGNNNVVSGVNNRVCGNGLVVSGVNGNYGCR
jgi:hypothetical protein